MNPLDWNSLEDVQARERELTKLIQENSQSWDSGYFEQVRKNIMRLRKRIGFLKHKKYEKYKQSSGKVKNTYKSKGSTGKDFPLFE